MGPPSTSVVTSKKPDAAEGKVNVDAVQVRVDPQAEWPQIFDEAWRINRDYFYAANYHGRDWAGDEEEVRAVPARTSRTVPTSTRVIQWMASELAVGHSYVGGGDARRKAGTVPGGLLGADYEVVGDRYRFRKVYGGLNWTPTLRAPLTEPGVDVQAGEYLLAVDGVDLRTSTNLHALFENTAGKLVELTVGPNADGTGSRTVKVVPIESEAGAAQSRLGRGQPAQGHRGHQGPGRLRIRAQHRRSRARVLQALLLPADRHATPSSSTSASTAAARSPTTTSISCAVRSSAIGRRGTASPSARRRRRSWGRR